MPIRVALVGATGLVGQTVIDVLNERKAFDIELFPFTSGRSPETKIGFRGEVINTAPIPENPPDVDYALFCAPNEIAEALVPAWVEAGIKVIDNSSVFRMDPDVPLVVPEVNSSEIDQGSALLANPNCSTIQLAVALAPLDRKWGIKRVSVSTYQSVSGMGKEAVNRWTEEVMAMAKGDSPFPRAIHGNVIPLIGDVDERGYGSEEVKLMNELPKILGHEGLVVSATCVRVPVGIGHGEAVEVRVDGTPSLEEVAELLRNSEGIETVDIGAEYVTPVEIAGTDPVYISRLRQHPHEESNFLFWVVADNLRKGAATNAVQILESWARIASS